jgi:hypothetical protein
MKRRTVLKVGLAGGALLAAGGVAWRLRAPTAPDAWRARALPVLRAVAPALLAGALPAEPAARAPALDGALERTLATIEGLPPATRTELAELFGLLDSAPGRWLAGVDAWDTATPDTVAVFLQRWRTHSFDLFQVGYHALHDLVLGPYYAEPATWEAIGYPGPIAL